MMEAAIDKPRLMAAIVFELLINLGDFIRDPTGKKILMGHMK